MELNFIFTNVKIYKVADVLDVIVDESFEIEPVSGEENVEVFASNDPALELSANGLTVTTKVIGTSKLRFMQGNSILKDIIINVVAATGSMAKTIGTTFDSPVTK